MEEERTFQWGSTIVPAIAIFIFAFAGQFLVLAIYPTIVGFQTRGDSAAIGQAVEQMRTSPISFVIAMLLLPALAGFWRGRALAAKIEYRPNLHAAVAGALAAVIMFAINFIMSGFNFIGSLLPFALWLVCAGGGAFLGAKLAEKTEE